MPARCPPQRLEPLRRRRIAIALNAIDANRRRNRGPVSGLAGDARVAHRPDRLPASCSGV